MSARPTTSSDKIVPKPSLGQYVFTEKLGSGTYATVYKAYRNVRWCESDKCALQVPTGIREVVAIKCVLKSSLNKASTENLLTEIELLKNLKHVHIVTLKDFQWDANYIYLIMEFCSGGDLSRFIRSKRALPETVVKRFLQQIASAMKFLWDNNVAHMDLKPQNILLTSPSNPQIKIGDFGFAKHLYDGDNLHVMRGSPLYMAPEIICQGTYDNRVDLWSVGVILFECLYGRPPFASKSFKELGAKIWDEKPVEMPSGFDISDKARDLTIRLLQRQPSERITFEEFFAHPFVDLEHIPSRHSLQTAIRLVDEAVKKDEEGDFKAAIRLYCEALEFFMPAIHYEKSTQKKETLRTKVKNYMRRAETLKQIMKSNLHSSPPQIKQIARTRSDGSASSSTDQAHSNPADCGKDEHNKQLESSNPTPVSQTKKAVKSEEESKPKAPGSSDYVRTMSSDALETLLTMSEDSQELTAVLKLINAAHMEDEKENYEQCLHHYEIALGAVLKILPNEPKGKRKDLLNSQVKKWMEKAERIKAFLDIQNLNTEDTSVEEEVSENDFLSESKQCSIQ